ncbi:MAG: GNAT family N-acetyltransferase [Dehalococcoidales bacterium]
MNYQIIEKLPTPEEYSQLRQLVGWGIHERDVIVKALPGSLYCVCAVKDTEIIGMARIVGDGGIAYYIQDVIVKPDYQRQGVGTQLMNKVMEYIHTHANNNSVIGLMAAKDKEPFYTRYGFAVRPDDKTGSGMTMFWKVEKLR